MTVDGFLGQIAVFHLFLDGFRPHGLHHAGVVGDDVLVLGGHVRLYHEEAANLVNVRVEDGGV